MSKIPLKTIEIGFSESSHLREGTFSRYQDVDDALRAAARFAPAGGAYDTIDIKVTWVDGQTYDFRFDLTRDHASSEDILADRMRTALHMYAGLSHPNHLTKEAWLNFLRAAKADLAAAQRLLESYQIGDDTPRSQRRMVQAIQFPAPANDTSGAKTASAPEHWYGPKYVKGRPVKDIAKLVRQELKEASKGSGPLRGAAFSVRSDHNSIKIEINNVTDVIVNTKRVRRDIRHEHSEEPFYNARGRAIVKAVEDIANAYNYDRSDTMTDYFNVGFYLTVGFGSFATTQREQAREIIDQAYRDVGREMARNWLCSPRYVDGDAE